MNGRSRRIRIRPTATWLILIAVFASTAATAAVITGDVRAPEDQAPVAGAHVEIAELRLSAVTGQDGTFRLSGVPPGRYTLRVSIPGSTAAPVERSVEVAGDAIIVAHVTLESSAKAGQAQPPVVVVTALRISDPAAREQEWAAPNIISVVTAEQIRQLPDVSAAEAIRRLPGVSAENDTGEARFINIRGLDADLNGTTFAGVRLLPTNPSSPSGGGRAVAFDTIPAGLIGSMTVTKTNTPEMDAEALGGTIEITPPRLGPNDAPFVSGRVGTGYQPLRSTWILDLELSGGTRFALGGGDPVFSAVGTIAVYNDRRGIDDLEASYVDNQSGGVPDKAYNDLQFRYYELQRKRLGFGGELAYQPSESHRWYIDAYQSGYVEDQNKNYLIFSFNGLATASATNPNEITDSIANYDRHDTDHTETLRFRVYSVGGRDLFGSSVLDYRLSYTEGEYIVSKDFSWDFLSTPPQPPPTGTLITYDNITRPNWPTYTIHPGGPNPFDPASYTLSAVNNGQEHDLDKELSSAVNWAFPIHLFGAAEQLKLGLSARLRDKTLLPEPFNILNPPAVSMSPFVSNNFIVYYKNHYPIGYAFNIAALENFWAKSLANGSFVPDTVGNLAAAQQGYQYNEEDIYAGYFQYTYTRGPLGILAGARVEATHASYMANVFDTDTNTSTGVTQKHSYTNVFPTVQVRYQVDPTMIARGTISSAIGRPGFQQITAAQSLSPSTPSITQGNPALQPTTGYSFDFTIDKYFGSGAILSVGVFDKELRNYITQTAYHVNASELPDTPAYDGFRGIAGAIPVTSFANISRARVTGTEFAMEYRFHQLPGFWSGFGVGGNWTWVNSHGDIRPGMTSALPSTARNTANFDLFYERGPVLARLAAYYTSRVLFAPSIDPIANPTGYLDVYQSQRFILDFASSYALNKRTGLYLNVKNLTDDPMRYTEGPDNRPIQREFYGVTIQAGVSFQF
jgi:TonB-dependent receptor